MAHYFLGNRLVASGQVLQWTDNHTDTGSIAYFCKTCGQIWARMVVKDTIWMMNVKTCLACADKVQYPLGVPGSFLHFWTRRLDGLPRELLLYELELTLKGFP